MDAPKILDGRTVFPSGANTREYAQFLDSQDPLKSFRDEFIIPTKQSLASKKLHKPGLSWDEGKNQLLTPCRFVR